MTESETSPNGVSAERRRTYGRPVRERVTSADLTSTRAQPLVRIGGTQVSEPERVFTRSLMRTQLRLALACLLAFMAAVAFFSFLITEVPALHDVVIAGVPLPWLMRAYGFYPIIIVSAVIYAIAAVRTERRFAALVEDE